MKVAGSDVFTVHIAGPVEAMVQKCSRCGAVLTDHRNTIMLSTDAQHGPGFWPVGGFVIKSGGFSALRNTDAVDVDEVPCGRNN